MKENLTALMSAFLRAWHFERSESPVFCDRYASQLLSEDFLGVAEELKKGIRFLKPDFKCSGEFVTDGELDAVLNETLSGAVLSRSAFFERALKYEMRLGAKQAVMLGAGYDTFSLSFGENMSVFEVDREKLFSDKLERAKKAGLSFGENVFFLPIDMENPKEIEKIGAHPAFSKEKKTVFSALGAVQYLSREGLFNMLSGIAKIACEGSALVLDFEEPREKTKESEMARSAGEAMTGGVSEMHLTKILEDFGFIVTECLDGEELSREFFSHYNTLYPNKKLNCRKSVKCLSAVKKFGASVG